MYNAIIGITVHVPLCVLEYTVVIGMFTIIIIIIV